MIRNAIQRFMYGRYGGDQLNVFLLVLYLIFYFIDQNLCCHFPKLVGIDIHYGKWRIHIFSKGIIIKSYDSNFLGYLFSNFLHSLQYVKSNYIVRT